jgi:hypothetical protein
VAESSEKNMPHRKRIILRILLLLGIILITFFALYRFNLSRKLERRLDEIRTAGYPVTGAKLNEWYSIPDGVENSADTFLLAFSYYEKWKRDYENQLPIVGRADLPSRTAPLDETMRQLIADYLADNQKTIELLHEGAAIEHGRYPIDFRMGFGLLMPHLNEVRTAGKLLKLEAILNAENSDTLLAVRSITSGFGVARSLKKEPTLMSQFVRIACQRDVITGLERVLNRTEFTDSQLVELAEVLGDAHNLEAITQAFIGERCTNVALFKNPNSEVIRSFYSSNAPIPPVIWLYTIAGFADRDAITYLDLVDDCFGATTLPLHEHIDVVKNAAKRIRDIPKSRILLRMFAPNHDHFVVLEARIVAQLRTAQMAIAALRYRLVTGKVPETLSELVPEYINAVAKDPFDGEELRYRKTDTGFVVYSIEEDRSDDGGREIPPSRSRRTGNYDITFTIGK